MKDKNHQDRSLRLETDRMVLRRPRESDHEFLMQLYANAAVMKYIHHLGKADSQKEAEHRFRKLLNQWDQHGFGMFFMEWKETGDPIGYCGPRILSPDENPELGYVVDQPYWGRGLALEAARRSVQFVQDTLKAPGMIALTSPDNAASQKILTQLGFRRNPARDGAFHGDDACFFELSFEGQKMDTNHIITFGDFVIRPMKASDDAAIAKYANNRAIAQYLRDLFPHPYGLADARAFIAAAATKHPPLEYAVATPLEMIGCVGLMPQADIHRLTAEIGYWLAQPFHGQGIMSQAVRLFSEYVFEQRPYIRLFAHVFSNNPASMRVLEKAGYALEGVMKSAVIKDGRILDARLYARIKQG